MNSVITLRKVHKILTGLMLFIGIAHLVVTLLTYAELSADAIWFGCSGLSVIFAGFLNILLLTSAGMHRLVARLCAIANLFMLVFFVLLVIIYPELHIFIGLITFLTAAIITLLPAGTHDFSVNSRSGL